MLSASTILGALGGLKKLWGNILLKEGIPKGRAQSSQYPWKPAPVVREDVFTKISVFFGDFVEGMKWKSSMCEHKKLHIKKIWNGTKILVFVAL